MLAELHGRVPHIPVLYGDAHQLPLRTAAVDVAVFVATLEFLADARTALSEAARVARRGIVVVALNRWSLGGLSRRCGPQSRRPLLGRARDYSLVGLRRLLRAATGARLREIRWASTLFPNGGWRLRARLPLGDVIGMAAVLAASPGPPSGMLAPLDSSLRDRCLCRLLAGMRAGPVQRTVP